MPRTVFPENQAQLDALSELALLFSSHGIEFWLRGGWALDFLLGRETRPHVDVDVVVWGEHRQSPRPLLEDLDYVFVDRGFRAQMDFTCQDVKLSVILLERQPNGDLTPQHCPELVWLPDALGEEKTLHGLIRRKVTPERLIHEKLHYEGTNPLRSKDVQSLLLLEKLVRG